jgi:hypothetical protein
LADGREAIAERLNPLPAGNTILILPAVADGLSVALLDRNRRRSQPSSMNIFTAAGLGAVLLGAAVT